MLGDKKLVWCGITAPVLFTLVILVLGFLTPGYSHLTQAISELGAAGAPYSLFMNVFGFVLTGVLLMGFSLGLYRIIRTRTGPVLVALTGLNLVLLALFPCDPVVTVSLSGTVHNAITLVMGILIILAMGSLYRRFYWNYCRPYTLVTMAVTAVAGLSLFLFGLSGWIGLVQRIAVGAPLLWIEIVSIRLLGSRSVELGFKGQE